MLSIFAHRHRAYTKHLRQGVLRQLRRDKPALLQDHNGVAKARSKRKIVQRDGDGNAARGFFAQQGHQTKLMRRIEPRGGLVSEQNFRFGGERSGNEHACALAGRELVDRASGEACRVGTFQRCSDGAGIAVAMGQPTKSDQIFRRDRPMRLAALRKIGNGAGQRFAGPLRQRPVSNA